jgi:(p)ppGpp synthase/HD superfamily hydrolase
MPTGSLQCGASSGRAPPSRCHDATLEAAVLEPTARPGHADSGGGHANALDDFPLGERFVDALAYATEAHRGQFRRGGRQPYVAHLLRVAGFVLEDGGAEDEAIAALLHDAAEDQGGEQRLADIRSHFGERVAEIVDALTDSYEAHKPPWAERKRRYLEHLGEADEATLRVSLADKLDNVRAIVHDLDTQGPEFWARFRRTPEEALWYYQTLAERLLVLHPGAMADEFDRLVAELRRRCG